MRLDEFLPNYEFHEIHAVTVEAPMAKVFTAIKELTVAELSPLIFAMLNLRTLPALLMGKESKMERTPEPFLNKLFEDGFIPLVEVADQEIVFGLIGQFWKLVPVPGPKIASPQEFLDYDDPDFAKVAANLAVSPDTDGSVRCSTETRIHVSDPRTRRKFAFYWWIISMGSGWIRVLWLRAIKRKAESAVWVNV
jgi:hypothetical protein